jgi:hypothetical protein
MPWQKGIETFHKAQVRNEAKVTKEDIFVEGNTFFIMEIYCVAAMINVCQKVMMKVIENSAEKCSSKRKLHETQKRKHIFSYDDV